MNILITGGAGFIGSHLSEKIIGLGHKVICIDNFNDYYDPAIKEYNLKNIIDNKNFTLYRADIIDGPAMQEIFSAHDIDIVFLINITTVTGEIVAGINADIGLLETLVLLPERRQATRRQGQFDRDDPLLIGTKLLAVIIENLDIITGYRFGR